MRARVFWTALFLMLISIFAGCNSNRADTQKHVQNDNQEAVKTSTNESKAADYSSDTLIKILRDSYWDSEIFDALGKDAIFEYLKDHFSAKEIMDNTWGYSDFLEHAGIPNVFLFIDELTSQGCEKEIESLIDMADKIGYMPSIVFGNYVADETHVIHYSNSSCFERIAPKIFPIGPFSYIGEIKAKINDGNEYWQSHSLCPLCCK